MSTDPCLDAALASIRPSFFRRIWNWYKRRTGYRAPRSSGSRFRSTVYPND